MVRKGAMLNLNHSFVVWENANWHDQPTVPNLSIFLVSFSHILHSNTIVGLIERNNFQVSKWPLKS